jgi:hypothetical protein
MAMLSPGVEVKEIDLSLRVDAVSNSIACFGGIFNKGPVGDRFLITSVDSFIDYFGYPTNSNFNDWYQVYNFLQYANKVWVSRAFSEKSGNAFGYVNIQGSATNVETSVAPEDTTFIKNFDDFEQMFLDGAEAEVLSRKPKFLSTDDNKLNFIARSYGQWGEKLSVGIATKGDIVQGKKVEGYKFEDLYEYHPGNDTYSASVQTGECDISLTQEPQYEVDGITPVYELDGITQVVNNIYTGKLVLTITAKITEMVDDKLFLKVYKNDGSTEFEYLTVVSKDYNAETGKTKLELDTTYDTLGVIDETKAWTELPEKIIAIPESTEIAVVILNDGDIVEKYIVNMNEDAKDYAGNSTYIGNVINRASTYVYVDVSSIEAMIPASVNDTTGLLYLTGSYDDTTTGDILDCYATATEGGMFANKEELDIDIVIANESAPAQAIELAMDRADCIAFIGARKEDVMCSRSAQAVNNMLDYLADSGVDALNYNTSFAAFFGNYKYQYDKYNDVYRWVNVAGDVAGLRADTSTKREIWWASAGLERGQISNCIKLAFNPTLGERDILYKNKINPIVSFPGQGTGIVWGQKTMQSAASAFDRINVRGLFNTLERAISVMAKNYVFELNDEFTRTRFETTVNTYLREIKANRGVYDFYVRCNEQNNTPQVVDSNQFIADIAIKPTRTAEFITLNFIAVSTGVEFSTIFS